MQKDFNEMENYVRESKVPGFQDLIFSWTTDEGEQGYCELTIPGTGLDTFNYAPIAKQYLEQILSFVEIDVLGMKGELEEPEDDRDDESMDLGLK